MTSEAVTCLQCDAAMTLAVSQRHCRCSYCGCKFVVDWSDAGAPQLIHFESMLAKAVDDASFEDAQARLTDLEKVVAHAQEEVEARGAELEEVRWAYQELRAEGQRVIAPVQNWTYAGGLLALIAWFLVFFVLADIGWYIGLVIALVLLLVTWGFHRRWQGAEEQARSELQEARQIIEQAEAKLNEALVHLEDYTLEKELCQREVLNYRQPDEPPSHKDTKYETMQ